jgi:hypothetical protein
VTIRSTSVLAAKSAVLIPLAIVALAGLLQPARIAAFVVSAAQTAQRYAVASACAVLAVAFLQAVPAAAIPAPAGGGGCVRSWRIEKTPRLSSLHPRLGSLNAVLQGVEVISPRDVWAVGRRDYVGRDGFIASTKLVLHWNGQGWRVVDAPGTARALNAVSAVSGRDVWAVGPVGTLGGGSVVLHWDGRRWAHTYLRGFDKELQDVSARTSDDVWAVGSVNQTPANPLVAHWDGKRWGETLAHGRVRGTLYGVAAVARADVWTVGTTTIGHWNGRTWRRFRSFGGADDVKSIGGGRVWAVSCGRILEWNGDSWRKRRAAPAGYFCQSPRLAATSPRRVWQTMGLQPGVPYWNGRRWRVISSARLADANLWDIDAHARGGVWAVGEILVRRRPSQVHEIVVARYGCR